MDIHQKLYDTIIADKEGTYKKVKRLIKKGAYTGIGLSALKECERIIDRKNMEVVGKYLIKDLTGLVREYSDKNQPRMKRIRKLLFQRGTHDWKESLRWGYCTGNKVVVKYLTERGITIPARERDEIKNTEYIYPKKRRLQYEIRELQDQKNFYQRTVERVKSRRNLTSQEQKKVRKWFKRIERKIESLRERLENL